MNSLVNFSRRRVDDLLARELGDHLVADRVHQVGLAEADPAVQEERVVGVAGSLGDRQAGGVGEPVGRPDDEVGERVARVEVRRAALAADAGRLEADLLAGRAAAGVDRLRPAASGGARPDDELDLDAVAHDPGQRLRDQGAIAGLEPVLGEAVRDGDPEPVVIDVDQLRCRAATSRSSPATVRPGARRGRHARLASRPSIGSDLLACRGWRWVMVGRGAGSGEPWRGLVRRALQAGGGPLQGLLRRVLQRLPPTLPGAGGPRRIAPPGGASQGVPARFADTPREYPCMTRSRGPDASAGVARRRRQRRRWSAPASPKRGRRAGVGALDLV